MNGKPLALEQPGPLALFSVGRGGRVLLRQPPHARLAPIPLMSQVLLNNAEDEMEQTNPDFKTYLKQPLELQSTRNSSQRLHARRSRVLL